MFRHYITNVALVGVVLAWLVPFWQIAQFGYVYAGETNRLVLYSEVLLFCALLVFGLCNILREIRRRRG